MELAVYASHAKDYYAIVEVLKKHHFKFLSLNPGAPLPKGIKALVVSSKDLDKIECPPSVKLIKVDDETLPITPAKVKLALDGKDLFSELVIGIDPGETYGLAVLGDLDLIDCRVFRDLGALKEYVDLLLKARLATKVLLRVGNGSPRHRDKVLSTLSSTLKGVEVEVVDESLAFNPPPLLLKGTPKDAVSAVKIALKRGVKLRFNK